MQSFTVGKNEDGMRLDKLIDRLLPQAGKGFAYKMLRKKNIVLNDKRAEGPERLKTGDVVKLYLADETLEKFGGKALIMQGSAIAKAVSRQQSLTAQSGAVLSAAKQSATAQSGVVLSAMKQPEAQLVRSFNFAAYIIYEDEDVIIVNKPAGILTQKAAPEDVSLNEYLINYLENTGKYRSDGVTTFKPSVCNRLDRNTAGLVCCGVSMVGLRELSKMFRDRTIHKYYLAICMGDVDRGQHIRAYLKKDEITNKVQILQSPADGAEYIETAYRPVKYSDKATLVEIELFTGKSHQIRAQLAAQGHPVGGDVKYGNVSFNRYLRDNYKVKSQLLVAYKVAFPDCELLKGVSGRIFEIEPPGSFFLRKSVDSGK